jgi:predicted O-linked N-acetylglucosamine transferase (SPINDLY family)
VSSDFRAHPTGRLLAALFAEHDPDQATVFGYALSPVEDSLTAKIRSHAAAWRTVSALGDRAIAQLMLEDKIDVAVFVALHFDSNRPTLAAFRCAPIQISLGDVSSSGIAEIDLLISDMALTPPNAGDIYSERVVRIPNVYFHPPLTIGIEPGLPPMVKAGYATFGSLNVPSKLNDRVVRLWADVLLRTPRSRLAFRYRDLFADPALKRRILRLMSDAGVAVDRLTFHGQAESDEAYLDGVRAADVTLDPFPYDGHTATFEALWMGVPVVTLAGTTHAGRFAAAQLKAIGLSELIAATPEDYVAIASSLATDRERLSRLRREVRENVRGSAVCDSRGLTRNLERVYRAACRRLDRLGG